MITEPRFAPIPAMRILPLVGAMILLIGVSLIYLVITGRQSDLFFIINDHPASWDSLAVHIHLPKSDFVQGEEIPLDIWLVNQSRRTLCVEGRLLERHEFRLTVKDSAGHELEPAAPTLSRMYHDVENFPCDSLTPGDSTVATTELASMYGQLCKPSTRIYSHPEGDFTVRVSLHGAVPSAAIPYNVARPVPADTALFGWLCKTTRGYNDQTLLKAAPIIEGALAQNPGSVYRPYILDLLIDCYKTSGALEDISRVLKYRKLVAEEYPNRFASRSAL